MCLTPRSNAAEMLHSGLRNKLRFHGALLVAYVEQANLRSQDKEKLEAHLALAREVGAEVHCLQGTDFVDAILSFAHQQRITQLFLGHTGSPSRSWLARSPIERLIDGAEGFDVRLFPHGESK